jgi:hypothetical protein
VAGSLYKPPIALAVVVLAWQAATWAARDARCESGFDECTWTNMQSVAKLYLPALLLLVLGWFAFALVRAVVRQAKATGNRGV